MSIHDRTDILLSPTILNADRASVAARVQDRCPTRANAANGAGSATGRAFRAWRGVRTWRLHAAPTKLQPVRAQNPNPTDLPGPRHALGALVLVLVCWAAPPVRAGAVSGGPPTLPGLTSISGARWNDTAVRKVMRTFAFGGQASDAQVALWAGLPPQDAIVQMLTFAEHNPRLSPPDPALRGEAMENRRQTLRALGDYWSSAERSNRVPVARRADYRRDAWHGAMLTWSLAARVRGGNPFRHRIGYWETNHHLAVNHAGTVSNHQLVRYYDDLLAALARGDSYDQVIAVAATSAAIAQQYGHRYNRYYDGVCYCNEDFARELHQLGFGVLGAGDSAYHERVSIKNTAKLLTGMRLTSREAPDEWLAEVPVYGTDGHVATPLPILRAQIVGANMRSGVRALARIEIEHAESKRALPVMIVQGLADDQVSAAEATALRRAWRAMPRKDLLRFLRAYAISTMFHSSGRQKQLDSVERFMIIANRYADTNLEHYHDIFEAWRLHWDEGVVPFEPWHDVFGHQRGPEAAASADLFRKHYARATAAGFAVSAQRLGNRTRYKDWRTLLPAASRHTVAGTAEWLWQRFVADGLKYFGPLERGHVYALLATGRDLGAVLRPSAPRTRVTPTDLVSGLGQAWMQRVAAQRLALGHASPAVRAQVNDRIGAAIDFIIATPFMLAEEGR